MSTTPLISVLLTSYNREALIAESIESVLAQTHRDFELIISDNCSTDRTVEIAREYASKDSRIRVSVNARNLGQFENRWQAATLARGEYLKYHDSDDVMYPHCLSVMVNALSAEPRAAFALSAHSAWQGGPSPMLLTPRLAFEREFLGLGLFQLGPAAALFRTQAFRDLGGFPLAGVASDYLFWLKACATVNVLLVPADLFYYRIHEGQELVGSTTAMEYARTMTAPGWAMLNSPECPLRGAALARAKRNFVYVVARGSFRYFRRRRFSAAAAVIRYSGIAPSEWVRYLRPPHRSATAGSPRRGVRE